MRETPVTHASRQGVGIEPLEMHMNRMSGVALVLATGLALGCGPELTQRGSEVTIASAAELSGCRNLGTITAEGSSGLWGGSTKGKMDDALIDLRNRAAKRGATHIRMVAAGGNPRDLTVVGTAYKCYGDASVGYPVLPARAARRPGCTRDIECKGDRICVDERCVDPNGRKPGKPTAAKAAKAAKAEPAKPSPPPVKTTVTLSFATLDDSVASTQRMGQWVGRNIACRLKSGELEVGTLAGVQSTRIVVRRVEGKRAVLNPQTDLRECRIDL